MPRLSTNECKEQVRLNIIKHRQTILKYLESTTDDVLKSKIVVNHYKYIKKCNLNINKQKSKLDKVKKKVNIESTPSENSDGYISVGSYEECNSNCSTSDSLDYAKTWRKSKRLKLAKHNSHKRENSKKKTNYVHDVDNIILNGLKDVEVKINQHTLKSLSLTSSSTNSRNSSSTFKAPFDKDLHNAKERQCRERIRNMFNDLQQQCSFLENNRRIPSKHSILIAAKKTCDMIQIQEKKLVRKKSVLLQKNKILKEKLANIQITVEDKLICVD